MKYLIFVVLKSGWLSFACANVKRCPLISELCWRGQKRREFSNWFPSFQSLNKLVYTHCDTCNSKEKLHSLLQNAKTTRKPTKTTKINKTNRKQYILFYVSRRSDTFSQYILVFVIKTFNYSSQTTVLLLSLKSQKVNMKMLKDIYHDLNIFWSLVMTNNQTGRNNLTNFDQPVISILSKKCKNKFCEINQYWAKTVDFIFWSWLLRGTAL